MKTLSVLILSFAFVAAGQAASYDSHYVANNASQTVISDQELSQKISEKLQGGWFSKGFEQVTFKVNKGAVLLQGTVPTINDKNKVEKEIRNIEGVQSLDSQLNVQKGGSGSTDASEQYHDSYSTNKDKQLNMKIRDQISNGILWNNYKEVKLSTKDGTVTIEGFVNDANDQQKLMDAIQQIDGVKAVKTNLKVKN